MFSIFYSLFSSNIPSDKLPIGLTPGYGGCLDILAKIIYLKFNEFSNNLKGKGGSVSFFFPSIPEFESLIFISNCWFINNSALFSGAIYVHSVSVVTFIIKDSFLISNWAKQSFNIYLLKYKLNI